MMANANGGTPCLCKEKKKGEYICFPELKARYRYIWFNVKFTLVTLKHCVTCHTV
jgi:hypothetical protein